MTRIERRAPAKVNLTLHVTGRRADGYHLLDSLVVFADHCDVLGGTPDEAALTLEVAGPFAEGVPTDGRNLVLRAAEALRAAHLSDTRRPSRGARLHLEKRLPHAAGIGSGSSDAAAALSLLAELWDVPPVPPDHPALAALGADVPVCTRAPAPTRMQGIGERLSPVPPLPPAALVLVRPPVAVPTGPVFAGLAQVENAEMEPLPDALDFDGFAAWLARQRNDLETPARAIAPVVGEVLARLSAAPQTALARMSGSGATCFALTRSLADAEALARDLRRDAPDWWVAAARMLSGEAGEMGQGREAVR